MSSKFSGLTNDPTLLTSDTVKIVAEMGQEFFVHTDILAAHPDPPRIMAGATEKRIDLAEWDGDTVGRLVQFLYLGDYQVPDSTLQEDDVEEASGKGEEGKGCGRRDGTNTPDTVQSQADREQLKIKDINILLAHARCYTLAQEKDVEALRVKALERLRTALGGIENQTLKKTSRATANVTELLEYVYSNGSAKDEMRDLVSKFAAENVEELMDSKEMILLLGKGGDFAVELMAKVLVRVFDIGRDLKGQVTVVDGKTASAEKVQQLEARIQGLDGLRVTDAAKVESLEAKVTSSEAKVESLGAKVASSEGKVASLEGKVASLEGKLASLEAKVAAAK